jgi:hypothetical protein
MENKKQLTEQFIITDSIPDILLKKLKIKEIKTNIIKSYAFNNSYDSDYFSYLKYYYKVDSIKEIIWIQQYITDHYRSEYHKTLIPIQTAALVQNKGDVIHNHHHIDENDPHGSPDISAIYSVATGDKTSYIDFEYQCGRHRHGRWKIPMDTNKIILFSSELRHFFTKNESDDPIVNLSFKFQLI